MGQAIRGRDGSSRQADPAPAVRLAAAGSRVCNEVCPQAPSGPGDLLATASGRPAGVGFFVQLTEAIAERQSLLMTGLDPNPEMLQSWAQRRGMANRSFLSQARHWIKAVVEETSPHVLTLICTIIRFQMLIMQFVILTRSSQ